MTNGIYSKVIVPSTLSEDGETPTMIVLTEEINAYVLWETAYDGTELIKWWDRYSKNKAIEESVAIAEAKFKEAEPIRAQRTAIR